VPLLIGGATTSKAHTAVKIAPHYSKPVVHVLDASRAVPAVGALLGDETREAFVAENRKVQEKLRADHKRGGGARPLLRLEDARARRLQLDWSGYEPPRPEFIGVRHMDALPLEPLVQYVDWTPFFHTWELKGTFPKIFEHPDWGSKARELYDDARRLLKRMVNEKRVAARAVYGFFPAASVGDDIEVYKDEARDAPLATFPALRQQADMTAQEPNRSLADYVAPRGSGRNDYIGLFASSAGFGLSEILKIFDADHDDYSSIMAKALADRLAEALAEWLHARCAPSGATAGARC
jgi:5-methyltetrahydrofolate--homocysteine methyltransferase